MLDLLGHKKRAGKNLGNVVSLLDAACLKARVPWIGRLILFKRASNDFVDEWISWAPFQPYLVEFAPRRRKWSDQDITSIRGVLASLPGDPQAWWDDRLHEADALLLSALLVILQQAFSETSMYTGDIGREV